MQHNPLRFYIKSRYYSFLLFGCFGSLLWVNVSQATDIQITRIDGTSLSGTWLGSSDGKTLEFKSNNTITNISMDEVASIQFLNHKPTPKPSSEPVEPVDQPEHTNVVFHLADGGQLMGVFTNGGEESLVCDSVLGNHQEISFDRLAGVQLTTKENFSRAHELFVQALKDRLPGRDVLITRDVNEPKSIRGRLVKLDPLQTSFSLNNRSRTVQTDKLYGIVFATGVSEIKSYRLRVIMLDESIITGQLLPSSQDAIRIETSIGATADIPVHLLLELNYQSDRIVFLSDLTPDDQITRGRLHRSWPTRMDQNVVGTEISMGGKRYAKGIGCHSYSELHYDIKGMYELFVSTIGIDDHVRPRGSVEFRVLGDDRILFESGQITGRSDPKDIIVDVHGVQQLTIVVDYADELDLSDHADWGDARLIKHSRQNRKGGL